ncbi:MAG TPA: CoA-binding protein [Thermoanaerobaculia bacterium]
MKRVAVLGASADHRKFGNKSLRAHRQAGWEVVPVNITGEEVEGTPSYRRIGEVPGRLDRVTVYLPPPITLKVLPEIAEADPGEVWFNPGSADREVVAKAKELGLHAIQGCSIVDLGLSPSQFP